MSNDSKPGSDSVPNAETDRKSLELLFILIIGALIAAAFISSLAYPTSSARAPWVVIVPLIFLVLIQINRTRKYAGLSDILRVTGEAFRGQKENALKVLSLVGWMIFLLGGIYLAGHFIGMAIFMFVLLRFIGRESLRVSLIATVAVVGSIYSLFELVFNIELYRGVFF